MSLNVHFAVPFFKEFEYLDQPVELNINYKPKIKELDNFINSYGENHRINLIINNDLDDKDFEIITALIEKYPSYTIIVCFPLYSKEIEEKFNHNQILHYYNQIISNWDLFIGFLSLNVTDIIVGNELAFNAQILSKKAKEKKISLRVFCNYCQSLWEDTPSIKTFFIRPEDLIIYQLFFDTFEFITNQNIQSINILYKIYAKDQKWIGPLNQIIIGYKGEENNSSIPQAFVWKRIKCDKGCIKNKKCSLCDKIILLNQTLRINNMALSFNYKE